MGCVKLGSKSQKIVSGKLKDLLEYKFGPGMQCLIIPSKKMHFMEEEALQQWKLSDEKTA